MSIIFHIDVNSAFLSWTALELLENGADIDLRTIPSIVGGDQEKRHGIVLAKSIPAKAYGIRTAEPVVNAFRKCPTLTMVPPNHAMYAKRSGELMDFLYHICPDIEQVSIDECFMDYTPIAAQYPSPEAAAAFIKDSVYENFHFTVNVGISDRKVLAKMASDFKKPNLVHTLYSYEIKKKLWPLPVSSLFMCGRSSVETLHNLGIQTIGDLANTPVDILTAHLKSHGITLWEYANGIDSSEVGTVPAKMKGVGNSITLREDALTRESACVALLNLAESVGTRLRASHEAAAMISTEIKYATFRSVSHQTSLPVPTASTDTIYRVACQLFDELWDGTPIRLLGIRTSKLTPDTEPVQMSLFDLPAADFSVKGRPSKTNYTNTRHPGKNFSDANNSDSHYFGTNPSDTQYSGTAPSALQYSGAQYTGIANSEKQKKLDSALDSLRNKYGKDIIKRGSLLASPDDFQKH